MPIYEFKCTKCGNSYESLCFRVSGEDRSPCPSCGSQESEKLMSSFASLSSGGGSGFDHAPAGASHSCSSHGGFS